ncbi:ATP-binding protein [Variovorax sp. OV329]|uniref:ATP-binding protein n=1 Tax=Variovorax sp. OV329 TaxID=1882825 RepID=UPI0008E967E7|nr:ATP-binding protein [Variovorax sp. OV329]SFM62810.1 PAS domain S-box-containing protein [Variovorax sp. OV329]
MNSAPPTGALPGLEDGAVYRSLFGAYPDGLLLVDLQGVIRLANPAACALLGYEPGQLAGVPVEPLVPDAIRPRHAAYREAYAKAPRARPMGTQMELVARRRDGSEVMVEIALSPLQDHGLPYVVAAMRGVAEYPRVKQALQRARYAEHLAQFGRLAVDARDAQPLLERVPAIAAQALQVESVAILLLGHDGQDLQVRAGVGLLPHEGPGKRLRLEAGSAAAEVIASGSPVRVDAAGLSPPHRTEGLQAELSVPLTDRGRRIGLMVARSQAAGRFGDEESRFLESLASLLATVLQRSSTEEALHHAQRLESVGQLTGGVAHDFNNLLTVISGNLQVLEDLPVHDSEPALAQSVASAMRATRRGAELTAKLLAFSRRQVLQPSTVDVAALLRSLTDMLRRTLDQRVSIALDAQAMHCLADPMQLESALLNIAINARDAMPQGGRLAFSCRPAQVLPAALASEEDGATSPTQGYVAIAITDDGSGMSEEVRERAFEPFFTTKEAGRGTGLGLSTVYGFARQSRGGVDIDSAPGAGTTVTLYLPRTLPVARSPAPEPPAGKPAKLPPGLHVLLVEDDAEVRRVVEGFLVSLNCELHGCATAEEALAVLDSDEAVDLLLSDVVLGPGMRGTELAEVARAQLPGLPVLLMSGYTSGLVDEASAWELLSKPFTSGELEQALLRALAAASS